MKKRKKSKYRYKNKVEKEDQKGGKVALYPPLKDTHLVPQDYYYIYTLLLEHDMIYVGQTTCFIQRLKQHIAATGAGALVTKKHRVLDVLDVTPIGWLTKEQAEEVENFCTMELIVRFGEKHVRGGTFISENPESFQNSLNREDAKVLRRTLKRIDERAS